MFDTFTTKEGRYLGKEPRTPAVHKAIAAYGLWNMAEQKLLQADSDANSLKRDILLNQAIVAIKKAYLIHNLPIYLFDLGKCLEAAGKLDSADEAFEAFLDEQANYVPGEGDYHFLARRDIDRAIREAKEALGGY
jgi:tetratricopeptide (TPR) repeat protein